MATQESLDLVQYAYIAFYGRPADAAGQEYWADQLDANGGDLSAIIDTFSTAPEYEAQYGDLTNEELVSALYQQILGRDADDAGLEYYVNELEAGNITKGGIALAILSGPLNNPEAADADDLAVLTNRKAVADAFTAAVEAGDKAYGDDQIPAAKALLAGVGSDTDPATVDVYAVVSDFPAADDAPVEPTEGETQYLAVDQDILTGTDGDDTFMSYVAQNMLGSQVNTLGSGDIIDGGAGTDTLDARVTAGLYGFNSDDTDTAPVQPVTTSVENIQIQAVESNALPGSDDNTTVVLNAKEMLDVENIGSVYSDADLLIQNLTTKNSDGGTNLLSDMTVTMAYTGNADSDWGASDLTVYFDQDYLVPEGTRTNPIVDFLAMNEDNYDASNGERPLDGVFFRELEFTLNGEEFDLTEFLGEDPEGTGSEITTYAEFLDAVKQALVQLKAANPDNAALQSVTADYGRDFTTDVNPDTLELRKGVAIRLTVDGLTNGVKNTLSVEATDLEVARAAGATVPNNNRYEIADDEPPVEGERLSINVDLEKVGLAGDGGELIIGSMNKGGNNVWNDVNTTVDGTTSGIEEFNVTVYGNEDKSSSLSGLHSTNNNLRVVTVATDEAQTGTYANLTIGNSNSDRAGVKDVQIFDASAFKGDLSLTAELSEELASKYLNLVDENPEAPAADNVEFQYTGGEGDDSFILAVDSSNFSGTGTTTREDFELTVDGGEGNDAITLGIFDTTGNPNLTNLADDISGTANWYDNSSLNANLTLNGGDGEDTIWTPGAGNVIINGGAGDDTVYADNMGEQKAVWVYNNTPVEDFNNPGNLQSDANDTYQLYGATLTVVFKGHEVTVDLQDEDGEVTDLEINQAIKEAINSDDVLNKLLVATDGPANTLIVSSLIDGEMAAGDLTVSLASPESLTAGEVQQIQNLWGLTGQTEASLIALMDAQIAAFDTKADYDESRANNGTDSGFTSDNTITGGTGDDVLVLGTGFDSNDTVVYEGFGNGVDTIVNFDTDLNPQPLVVSSQDVTEEVVISFSDMTGSASSSIVFDGETIDLTLAIGTQGLIPAEDVAYQFATQYATATNPSWTAVWNQDNTVTLTSTAGPGDQTDLTAGDFNIIGATGTVSIDSITQGSVAFVPGTYEVMTVDFTNTVATADGSFTFDGVTINYSTGDGEITLADAVASASYANWTAADNMDGTVTFTAKDFGDVADADSIDIFNAVNGTDGLSVSATEDVTGADATGTQTTIVTNGAEGLDYLDFSAYNVEAVYVNGVLEAGTAPNDADHLYVEMTEETDNAGEYLMEVYEAGADGVYGGGDDVLVGVIGSADFGTDVQGNGFVTENFII